MPECISCRSRILTLTKPEYDCDCHRCKYCWVYFLPEIVVRVHAPDVGYYDIMATNKCPGTFAIYGKCPLYERAKEICTPQSPSVLPRWSPDRHQNVEVVRPISLGFSVAGCCRYRRLLVYRGWLVHVRIEQTPVLIFHPRDFHVGISKALKNQDGRCSSSYGSIILDTPEAHDNKNNQLHGSQEIWSIQPRRFVGDRVTTKEGHRGCVVGEQSTLVSSSIGPFHPRVDVGNLKFESLYQVSNISSRRNIWLEVRAKSV